MSTESAQPSLSTQSQFWDSWNERFRASVPEDAFMRRQREIATELAREILPSGGARILDVGCGTGWLASALRSYGTVTATDLSQAAVDAGKAKQAAESSAHPPVQFLCGDFLNLDLPKSFDLIVTADVIAHVADQQAFMDRVTELLKPGGTFLLMTQNPFVWNRSSRLMPKADGQLRDWPSLLRIRAMMQGRLEIRHVSSIVPGGDRGLLFWVDRGITHRVMGKLRVKPLWDTVLERALVGRELIVVARRPA